MVNLIIGTLLFTSIPIVVTIFLEIQEYLKKVNYLFRNTGVFKKGKLI